MEKEKPAVRPVPSYDAARYPQRESAEGAAAQKSIGGKLGSALLAATLGLTLTACDKGGGQRHPGPPPVRPDFKTEQDAKKAVEKAAKAEKAPETPKQEP